MGAIEMTEFQKLKVFLSHSSKDKDFAERLATQLLDYGVDVWFDQWEIYGGNSITDEIEKGLKNSTILLLVLSKNSIDSKWVHEEYKAYHNMKLFNTYYQIIPVIIEPCELPPFLKDIKYIKFIDRPFETAFKELIQSIFKIPGKRSLESVSTVTLPKSKLVFVERAKLKQLEILDHLILGYIFIRGYIWQSLDRIKDGYSKDEMVEFLRPATTRAREIREEFECSAFYLRGLTEIVRNLNILLLKTFAAILAVSAKKEDLQVLRSDLNNLSGMIETIKVCRNLLNRLYLQDKEALDKEEFRLLEEYELYFD